MAADVFEPGIFADGVFYAETSEGSVEVQWELAAVALDFALEPADQVDWELE